MTSSGLRELRARRFALPAAMADRVTPALARRSDALAFSHQGRTLVGLGRAGTLVVPGGTADGDGLRRAVATLAAVPAEDHVTPGVAGPAAGHPHPDAVTGDGMPAPVVAFGALPFDRAAAASLTVPAVLLGREADGRGWVTVCATAGELPGDAEAAAAAVASLLDAPGPADGPAPPPPPGTPSGPPPVRTTATPDREAFVAAVGHALGAIDGGRVRKVVLGRGTDVVLPAPLDLGDLVERWGTLEPACTTFALPVVVDGAPATMVGASPELLLSRRGSAIGTRPLAGTTGHDRDGDRPVSGGVPLIRSRKDGLEHRLVVETVADRLRPWCSELTVPDHPGLYHLRSITHLATEVTGRLRGRSDGEPSALELVGVLHPTPAVGGVPTAPALELIETLEREPRGPFAGPVGWVDGAGDGTWVVGIRSLVAGTGVETGTAAGDRIRLWAGVGIVDGSDPAAEWAETELKLAAVADVAVPPPGPAETRQPLRDPVPTPRSSSPVG